MKSTVTSKGQITLPVEIRDQLGLEPGVVVSFELREGGAFLRKGAFDKHPVDRVFGRLRLEKPVDTLLDEMRGRSLTRTVSPPDRLGDLFLEIFGPTRGEDVEIPPREPHDPMDLE